MTSLDLGALRVDAEILFNRVSWFTPDTLPVTGLDTVHVQDTLFTLRALDHGDQGIADAYLRAVQCAQLAHDRLLRDLREVDRHLSFWQTQMAAGGRWSHVAFMLLSRGPTAFAADVLAAGRRALVSLRDALAVLGAAAAASAEKDVPEEESQLRAGAEAVPSVASESEAMGGAGRAGAGGLARSLSRAMSRALSRVLPPSPAAGAGAVGVASKGGSGSGGVEEGQKASGAEEVAGDGGGASATDMMQQRILLLRTLRRRLACALSEVEGAAAHLWLGPLLETHCQKLGRPSAAAAATVAGARQPGDLWQSFTGTGAGTTPFLRGFAASAASETQAAGPGRGEHAAGGSSGGGEGAGGAAGSPARFQELEHALLRAVHGMLAALERLLGPAGLPAHVAASPTGDGDPAGRYPSGAGEAGEAAARQLSLELSRLLGLLRLRPLALRVLRLPPGAAAGGASQTAAAAAAPVAPASAAREQEARGRGDAGAAGAEAEAEGLQPLVLTTGGGGGTARSALDAARRAAALSGPLLPLPPSARMPSRFQRHWVRYGIASGLALYGGVFLYRHSRLAGSDDLDRWIMTSAAAVRAAFRTHVAEPLAAVHDELFRTFRDRPAIVSNDDFALSRQSLLRMLADFAADHPEQIQQQLASSGNSSSSSTGSSSSSALTSTSSNAGSARSGSESAAGAASGGVAAAGSTPTQASMGGGGGGGGGAGGGPVPSSAAASASTSAADGGAGDGDNGAVAAGMAVLMRSYEAELRSPLRNLLAGDLARALLIQVQHVKVDGEAAMLRLDQILRANELSISLMAALPALGLAALAAAGLARLLVPRAPDPRREAVPSRLAMAALEVALEELARAEEAEGQTGAAAAAGTEAEERAAECGRRKQTPAEAAASSTVASPPSAGGAGSGVAAADPSGATGAAGTSREEELRGLVVYRMFRAYVEVTRLYAAADRTSRFSEWPQLHADLLRLAAPGPTRERLATHRRIMRTYTVFQR